MPLRHYCTVRHGSFEQARRIRQQTPDETTAKFRRHASGKDISRTLDANYERESETMGLGSQIWTVWAKKWWGNRSAETEKETEHVCPRIASSLCRTTRRTCGITKQNENSCITKKYHNNNTYHLPHTIIAWETRNTFIKHTNKISTLTQSHTHQKSKCEKMDSNTGMYGVDYCHDIPWSDIKFTLRGKALL